MWSVKATHSLVSSFIQAALTKYHRLYKQEKCIPPSSRGWGLRSGCQHGWVVVKFLLWVADCQPLTIVLTWQKVQGISLGISVIRVLPSWSIQHPKVPPPNTIFLGIRFWTCESGTDIQSTVLGEAEPLWSMVPPHDSGLCVPVKLLGRELPKSSTERTSYIFYF